MCIQSMSIKSADFIWEPKGRDSVFPCCQEDLSSTASSNSERVQPSSTFYSILTEKILWGQVFAVKWKLLFQCTEEHIGGSNIWSCSKLSIKGSRVMSMLQTSVQTPCRRFNYSVHLTTSESSYLMYDANNYFGGAQGREYWKLE